ncbi:MAG: MlaD family protein [Pseudomonadota bacterium]|nr:MlaD family protein [Pseudomonadota bacterium]
MENRAFALMTGLFVVALGLALMVGGFWIGQRGEDRIAYLVVSQGSVAGLSPYSTVQYRGVEVGQVTSVVFANDQSRDILIRIEINPTVPITANTYATLRYQGITGLAQVELADEGPVDAERLVSTEANLARIPMKPSLIESIGESGEELLKRVQDLVQNLNEVLNEENQARFSAIMANVENMTQHLSAMADGMSPFLEILPKLGEDSGATIQSAQAAIQRIGEATEQLREVTARAAAVGEIAETAGEEFLITTIPQINETLLDLENAARNIERLSQELQSDPSSIVYGRQRRAPAPGEAGYGDSP